MLDPTCQQAESQGTLNARCLCSQAAKTIKQYYSAEEEEKIAEWGNWNLTTIHDKALKLILSIRFIKWAEKQLEENRVKQVSIEWAYATNITDHNEKIKLDYQVRKCNECIFTKVIYISRYSNLFLILPEGQRCTQTQIGERSKGISCLKVAEPWPEKKA